MSYSAAGQLGPQKVALPVSVAVLVLGCSGKANE